MHCGGPAYGSRRQRRRMPAAVTVGVRARPKARSHQQPLRRPLTRSRSSAAARAASETSRRPASGRSPRAAPPVKLVNGVEVRSRPAAFATRRCAAPRAATCGLCVTTSTCTPLGHAGQTLPHRGGRRPADARSPPRRTPGSAPRNRPTAPPSSPASAATTRRPRRPAPAAPAPGRDWWRSGSAPDRSPPGTPAGFGQARDLGEEPRLVQAQRRQLLAPPPSAACAAAAVRAADSVGAAAA